MAHILVVAPDPAISEARIRLLTAQTRRFSRARSVEQALSILDAQTRIPVDLIIADLDQDPCGQTGYDLARAVRGRPGAPRILLLVFSEQLAEARDAECDGLVADVLARRAIADSLARKVREMLL